MEILVARIMMLLLRLLPNQGVKKLSFCLPELMVLVSISLQQILLFFMIVTGIHRLICRLICGSLECCVMLRLFRVCNIHTGTQPRRGRLLLTPGSCLSWLGFSEEGHLSSFDSKKMRI